MKELNIVELIENNPITKLSSDYNVKLLTKIKEQFTDFEQQLFLSSFYSYLNYHPTNDFVIDLDSVWGWMGYGQKVRAKNLLERSFIIDRDYKRSSVKFDDDAKVTRGGHNKEVFMLNIKTFKSMCLKTGTAKSDEIHDYFLKMEQMIQEVINEESSELKKQLTIQSDLLKNVEKDKEYLKEKTIIEQFPLNTQCIYIGKIDNKTKGIPGHKMYHETVIKFGQTNDLNQRVTSHRKTYDNFILYAAFKVKNKIEVENLIKKHPILSQRLRIITGNDNIAHREILALDESEFTLEKIECSIKEIIKQNEYNLENYNLLLQKNAQQEEIIIKLNSTIEEKDKHITTLSNKLENYTGHDSNDITVFSKNKITSQFSICKYGYYLYAFEYEPMRFICSITRQKDFETINKNLKHLHPTGEMKYKESVKYPFSEKNMTFMLKQDMTLLGCNKFEGSYANVKLTIDIAVNLEKLLIDKSDKLPELLSIMKHEQKLTEVNTNYIDPESPQIKKAKRSIDQINKDTGDIIQTHESIEAAGRSLGLTTGTAIGIALREKRVCKGFLWRYSGFSKEEQYSEQPVYKICCSTGIKMPFKTIADAARDANISAPALRQRILTHVHLMNYHYVFVKE